MKIIKAEVETIYNIEYTFEDYIKALEDPNLRLGRPNAFRGLPNKHDENTDGILLKAFQALNLFDNSWHGDTCAAIAESLGFDGWKNAGFYEDDKDVRNMVVYRRGADDLSKALK